MSRAPLLLALVLAVALQAAGRDGVLDGVPSGSEVLPGYRLDSVAARMSGLALHPVEGVWQFVGEGTLVAVERDPSTSGAATLYRLVAIRPTDLSLRPGTVMGYMTPAAERGVFDARIYSRFTDEGTRLSGPERFTVTLTDNSSRFSLEPYGRKYRLNWWRLLLPFLYRSVITPLERNPPALEGCVRVYPAPSNPTNPRYL